MSDTVKAALIAGVVALITSVVSAGVTISIKSTELARAERSATETKEVAEDLLKSVRSAEERIKQKQLPVGTVIASLLDYAQFREAIGADWVPVDSREISTASKYAVITGRTTLPDMRGMFLRGLNEFEVGRPRSDKMQDPEQGRKVGSFQPDSVSKHSHPYKDIYLSQVWGSYGDKLAGQAHAEDHDNKGHELDRRTEEEGAEETRPKNVTVYYYVKIN